MPSADPFSPASQAALRLASDLEQCLKAITPDKRDYHGGLKNLIERHEAKFSNLTGLHEARIIRNCIAHGNPVTEAQVQRAEVAFEQALKDIVPFCPEPLHETLKQRFASGRPSPEPVAPPSQPAPPVPPRTDPPPSGAAPASPPAVQPPVYLPPPTSPRDGPARRSRSLIWYILAGAFLLVAAFAYIVRPAQDPAASQGVGATAPPLIPVQPLPYKPELPAPERPQTSPPSREDQFLKLINTNLSISSTEPNIAFVIVASGPDSSTQTVDVLQGFLADTKAHVIFNLADIDALKVGGFFDDMYAGNGRFLSQAARLSRVDYFLLGRASVSFRRQPDLDPDLMTCDLTLMCRLVDHSGTVVQSGSFSAPGPGFTRAKAVEAAAANVARQLKEKILDSIR